MKTVAHRRSTTAPARIAPAAAPYAPEIQARLDAVMRGRPPLVLFTTLARDARLFHKFFDAGLLDRGHLTLRQREIVIDRVTAQCGSEYEWGVHIAAFAAHVQLDAAQVRSLAIGSADDPCWRDAAERRLIRACDAVQAHGTLDDALWSALRVDLGSDEAMLEWLMLVGFYRTVSLLTNTLRLPLEDGAARFPERPPLQG